MHLEGLPVLINCSSEGDLFPFFGRENFAFLMELLKRLDAGLSG